MQVEPTEIRAMARRIREQGAAMRSTGESLAARAMAMGWTGLAAEAMSQRATLQGQTMAELSALHEGAARALEAHAAAVEDALALIAEIERRVHEAVNEARGRIRRFLGGLLDKVDPFDDVLDRFVPPPPGSPEWLRVRLPGVALPGARR